MFDGNLPLILWLGQTIPRPAPADVLQALTAVEVTNDVDTGDGFQITFTLGKDRSLDYHLLRSGAVAPMARVCLGVLRGAVPEVLINGVVTHHQVTPSFEPGQSQLTVTGQDMGLLLDLEEKNLPHKNLSDAAIVEEVLRPYTSDGLTPPHQITPTTHVRLETQGDTRQYATDWQLLQRLAQRNGFVCYLEPQTLGVTRVYWGPEQRSGLPQPALTLGMGAATNVERLDWTHDALAPSMTQGAFVEPLTKTSIPIPWLPSLRVPPLAAQPTPAVRRVLARTSANQDLAQAALTAVAAASQAPEAIRGEGEVQTTRYGSILRARRLVGVRGAGLSYDGTYYVRRVTHSITLGSYTQRFTLSREGTGALLPVVRV